MDIRYSFTVQFLQGAALFARKSREIEDNVEQIITDEFEKPGFLSPHTNFFPHQFLSASCASWAVTTAIEYINEIFSSLDFVSPLSAHIASLTVPPVNRQA